MKLVQFLPLVIEDYEDGVQHFPKHSHNYYEIVYIYSGTGVHMLNEKRLLYGPRDVYLISPTDHHVFEIATITHFTILKFSLNYITLHPAFNGDLKVADRIKHLMHNLWIKENKIQINPPYDQIIERTLTNMVDACNVTQQVNEVWLYHQFLSIMDILRTNIYNALGRQSPSGHMDDLLDYVHEHIYQPKMLQISNMASRFHISESYFSNYFRKTYGQSYRDYTRQYKLNLIESRLMTSNINMKEIAKEFGFHDISHFYQYYKAMRNDSPINFRKKSSSLLNHTKEIK
jgi:AraC family transcriptional regulator, L-rhamnose operon regulatory protein RhaS